jgi:nitrate reductase assembly molybdenum cofactor insertion protein NarJ
MKNAQHYAMLAEMFRYPTYRLKTFSGDWKEIVDEYDPALHSELDPFLEHISEKPLTFQQEYFVATFDVQPLCVLDTGYVLFGEDYRRGQFMANLSMEHKKAGNNCGSDLPDHLPNILMLLSKMKDRDVAEELTCSLLLPAVESMIAGFRNRRNYYAGLLRIVYTVMQKDYPARKYETYVIKKNAGDCSGCELKTAEG